LPLRTSAGTDSSGWRLSSWGGEGVSRRHSSSSSDARAVEDSINLMIRRHNMPPLDDKDGEKS
jgi:hypothetical protein